MWTENEGYAAIVQMLPGKEMTALGQQVAGVTAALNSQPPESASIS